MYSRLGNFLSYFVSHKLLIALAVFCEDEERRLYETLFEDYNSKVRPRIDPNDRVDVEVDLELMSIKTLVNIM